MLHTQHNSCVNKMPCLKCSIELEPETKITKK